jgi:2-C-methyl-D-erythritol 4-phosphate cytidylyltransferase
MKKFVIIVAGGSGQRMGTELPKQFLELCGKPVLMHTLQRFFDFDPECELILVLPITQQEFWKQLCLDHSFLPPHQIASGGETRFHSVQNGLKLIQGEGIVFIHDGVRPLVSRQTLIRCFETAQKYGNALPVLPVSDSLRHLDGDKNTAIDRSKYIIVQTPQTFSTVQVLKSFSLTYDPGFTDDATVVERAGFNINLVQGNPENIKITTPTDLIMAEAFIHHRLT